MRTALIVAAMILVTGCAPSGQLDTIMGRTEGTPVPAPQKLDCDLIFPPASVDP
jgi:hypothetical protein